MHVLSPKHRMKTFLSVLILGVGFIWVVGVSAEPPPGVGGEVTVKNDDTNPVPVVIQPERTPYRDKAVDPLAFEGRTTCDFEIPQGKRLVIEVLSARVPGAALSQSVLTTKLLGESELHADLPLGFTSVTPSGFKLLTIKVDGPFYADDTNSIVETGADLRWGLVGADPGAGNLLGQCFLSGYLIPAPIP